ncbi:MAG: acyltransferase family protein [Pseudomonadota bacterium]
MADWGTGGLGRIEQHEPPGSSVYRPEIDGLRAIAVLAVVLFHARIRGFSGGYAGVDMFFALSGYLIARLILRESAMRRFSLIAFYERRARRILPALLAMLTVSGCAAWMLLPGDFADFGESLAAISLFASNLLFWHRDGYFSLASDATPLLHTWSLAVEEQFYIVFPALIMLARRGGRRVLVAALMAIGSASFAYSVWAISTHPDAAFYSPLSRAWEFIAGALLATGIAPAPVRRFSGDALAACGLAATGYSVWHLTPATPFPGLQALPPVLGTVLLLWGTQAPASRVATLLRAPPLVAIGLISYSLYLWHWPLMVFGGYYLSNPFGHIRPVMALPAFPVAWLSWRYVERPFREPRMLLSRRALIAVAASASATLALYGVAVSLARGVPARFDPVIQRLSAPGPEPDYRCSGQPVAAQSGTTRCRIGGGGPRPSFVLWGDSHAAVYFPALDALARRHGIAGYDLTALGCPPLLPITARAKPASRWMFAEDRKRACLARNDQILRFIAEIRPRRVLLAAHWSSYGSDTPGSIERDAARRAFEQGVRQLRALGVHVYVALDVPNAPADPRTLAKAQLLGRAQTTRGSLADYLRRDAIFRTMVADLQRRSLITVIDPAERLCSPEGCRAIQDGYALYFDSSHLSRQGALYLAPLFEPMMR